MEERRGLLAVVLIFLLLFGYNYYARRQAEDRAPEVSLEAETESVVGAHPDSAGAPADAIESAGKMEGDAGSTREVSAAPVTSPSDQGQETVTLFGVGHRVSCGLEAVSCRLPLLARVAELVLSALLCDAGT